nr:DUF397 domain-containing protein [Actinomadura sp. 6K520]
MINAPTWTKSSRSGGDEGNCV